MIDLTKILIRRPYEGYYIRWYYNGWHYWHFLPGKQIIRTSGENYRTTGTRQVSVSSGQLDYNQCVGVRTILSTREVYLYNDSGWGKIRVEPGSWNDIKNNYIQGYEVELTITIGSREVSQTGYSPSVILPLPPPTIKYGLLYNWYVINDAKGIAPVGYHLPSISEYNTLKTYVGSAGLKLREIGLTYWNADAGATNEYGFNARGSGHRDTVGVSTQLKEVIWFWMQQTYAQVIYINKAGTIGSAVGAAADKKQGYAIRCLKDTTVGWHIGEKAYDVDGNKYDTVMIGTQVWLTQSLVVRKFRDGTAIPEITIPTSWAALTTAALCAYNSDWNNVFEV